MLKLSTVYVLVFLVGWIDGAAIPCGLNQYTVKIDGRISCINCTTCPLGMGTVPQCGAFLTKKVVAMCKMCVTGLTYSVSNDVTSCQPCTICVEDEVVIKNCTRVSNTVCGKCKKGYYRSFVYSCEKCSECCGDRQEEDLEKQCLKQGLPQNQACRNTGRTCKTTRPTPTNTTPTNTTPTNTPRILTRQKDTKPLIWYIVGAGAGTLLILITIFVLYRRFRSNVICLKERIIPSQESIRRNPGDRESLYIRQEESNQRNPDVSERLQIKNNCEASKSLDGHSGS